MVAVKSIWAVDGYACCIHQNHEKTQYRDKKKVVREFDRGTRGRFLRKAVPRHGGRVRIRTACSTQETLPAARV